jgi:hypothetical protein
MGWNDRMGLLSDEDYEGHLNAVVGKALSEREHPNERSGRVATARAQDGVSRSESVPNLSQGDGDGSVGDNGQAPSEAGVPFASAEARSVRSHPSRPQVIAPHPDPLEPSEPWPEPDPED